MRLHRLEIEGFGPFRSRQIVDFDAFADDGIFVIAGRTGAGKSSILDAICFGLYGGVPRYEGSEKRLRSDHCEPGDASEVSVEFSTAAGRFRVTRSPEYLRAAKRGGGMTRQAPAVSLGEWTGTGWIGRAARAVDVAAELDGILHLSREQFLQVILLAQNRFSEFLLAGSKDRQALLRRLFGTQRFDDVQARFDDRRRGAERALGARLAIVTARIEEAERLVAAAIDADDAAGVEADATVRGPGAAGAGPDAAVAHSAASPVAPSTATRLDDLRRALARAAYRRERRAADRGEAERASRDADAALAARREERRAQQERDRARAALAVLDAEESIVGQARSELSDARAAEVLRSTIAASERARAALATADEAEHRARAAWRRFEIATDDEAADTLERWAAERTKESGAWARARDLEGQEPALAAELQLAEAAVAEASEFIASTERERSSLPERLAALTSERDESRRAADREPHLRAALEAAESRLQAVRDAERIRTELVAAEARLAATTSAHAATQSTLAQLRQRRFDQMAGELAAGLIDRHACPVCGSHDHPAPASHVDPVSADDIDDAESARDAATDRERIALAASSTLHAALAAAEARAESQSAPHAEESVAAVGEQHAQSAAAASRWSALDDEVQGLVERIEHLARTRTEGETALARTRERRALLGQRLADARAAISEARGPFDTVAERLVDAERKAAGARALAAAVTERTRRADAVAETEHEVSRALAGSPFPDTATAEQALLPISAQHRLEERISTHAAHREKERAILFDLELRTLPEEAIDVAAAQASADDARALWSQAADRATRAAGVVERLTDLIDSADAEHTRTADEAAQFEVLQNLAETIAGRGSNTRRMTLETFVLAAELEEIVEAANRRLHDMSSGRFQLRHSDALAARGAASGLGIVVADAFTGQPRPPQSLSGGETFLASLALALGLAEVVTARAGGIRLDTLFIDEGFGSLDGDTLDVAMRTLDELRQGGRTVGVISHVEAMQEQIPAQLTVRAMPNGPSIIETR